MLSVIFSYSHSLDLLNSDLTKFALNLEPSEGSTSSNNPEIVPSTSNTSDSTNTHTTNITTTTQNILNISRPNALKDAGLAAVGMKLGLSAAKNAHLPGKSAAMAIGAAVGATMGGLSSAINEGLNDSQNKGGGALKLTMNLLENNSPVSNNQLILANFPFNLLTYLFTFNQLELVCLTLIFNCFLSTLIKHSNFNYSKYIPENRYKVKIEYLINRYIDIWYKSNIFVFTICWVCLLVMNFATKYSFILIFSS